MLARLIRRPLPTTLVPGVVPHGVNILQHAKRLTAREHRARWEETQRILNALPIPQHTGRKVGASLAEATAFQQRVRAHPLIRNIDTYVPNGACFAKAFIAHLIGLQEGYHKDSFLKLIAAWNGKAISHHMVLGLRRDDRGWWALDFLDDGPKHLEDWAGNTTYAALANRWGPEGLDAEKYSREHFWTWADPSTGRVDPGQPLFNDLMGAVKQSFTASRRGDSRASGESRFEAPAGPSLADQQTVAAAVAARAAEQATPLAHRDLVR